jgi:GTP cyclohydrolase I
MTEIDRSDQLAQHITEILKLLRLDVEAAPELRRTPQRVAQLYLELFQGVSQPPPDIGWIDNPPPSEEMILVRDLPFYSLCTHHLLPFFGHAHIAYAPRAKIVGFSGLARIVRHFASKPQLQERLTNETTDHIQSVLEPEGVIVSMQARHLCLEMRGERVPALVETTAARGVFQEGPLRDEFFARLKGNKV